MYEMKPVETGPEQAKRERENRRKQNGGANLNLLKDFTKEEKSWMLYDWANSAHSVIVVTILPIFFNTVASYTKDAVSSMSAWGYATSLAMAIVALAAPILGAFGDFAGLRKKLFGVFLALGCLSCLLLGATPLSDFTDSALADKMAGIILGLYILSTVGFAGANLYYDSFLSDVTTDERMDRVSTMGYGLGYLGGSTIPLLIFLVMNGVGVPMLTCLAFIFAFTGLWWLAFSLPFLKNVRQKGGEPFCRGAAGRALRGLGRTMKEIWHNKEMLVFLLAYFFYIDGVNTVIHMSTTYGDMVGLGTTDMMLALLMVQVLGLPFCLLYIRLSARFGARAMVGVGICVYVITCVVGFFMRSAWQFWLLAFLVSTSQGGIQALSRSMFGRLIPDKGRSAEFFGFYDIFGKFSAIIGPALVGVISAAAAEQILAGQGLTAVTATAAQIEAVNAQAAPLGMLGILLIFALGGGLYFFVLPRVSRKSR